ncbi:hypothetical protein R1sor_013369 [Riccia sorocarpa]|uniref:Fatty acyl-CoA reductase n=1 Tax=Riccia sorocarpa TaxID=122646 RepID=A0ABD3H6C9_9MARC
MAPSREIPSELQRKSSDNGAALQLQTALPSNTASEVSAELGKDAPLEIRKFLKDKSILITGATGFLGKVLVEKILRAQPEIKQLYLLVQPRGGVCPEQRVQSEILEAELFKVLRSQLGHEFERFTTKKITVVGGNVRSPDLGISSGQVGAITRALDLIMHVAGNTKWDERFDVSVRDNALGPTNLMKFAKTCPKLKLFLHVSTACVNSVRKGSVTERPFKMGETMAEILAKEADESLPSDRDIPRLDVNFETELAEKAADCGSSVEKEMVEFGRRRAQLFGWQDIYAFTKAMGEMLLFENRGHIPLAIVRPPGVVSTYKEPFPGWIEGFKVVDPIAIPYGKGQFSGFTASENSVFDLVPVDIVVNTMLAVAAKHYGCEQQDTYVYHSSSTSVNPFNLKGFGDAVYNHFKAHPMVDKLGNDILVKKFRCFEDADEFKRSVRSQLLTAALVRLCSEDGSNFYMEEVLQRKYAKLRSDYNKLVKRIELLWIYTHHFTSYDNHNAETLLRQIFQDEQETFGYSVSEVDWISFLAEVHLPGLRRHVLKEHRIQRLK